MSIEKAVAHYKGEAGHQKMNCAESVAIAFKDTISLSEQQIAGLTACGGGRAPEGVCGALHAARMLLTMKDVRQVPALDAAFLTDAGSLKCREIRSLKKLSCGGCVGTAAAVIAKS